MKPFTAITIVLLSIVAIVHALRLSLGWPIVVNGVAIADWASAIGLAVALALAIGLWWEARPARAERRGVPGPVTREARAPRFTVQQGRRYQAMIELGFFEQIASNETIAGMLRDAGFSEVHVTGSGGMRHAEAVWPLADRTEALPPQIKSVAEVTAAA